MPALRLSEAFTFLLKEILECGKQGGKALVAKVCVQHDSFSFRIDANFITVYEPGGKDVLVKVLFFGSETTEVA